MMLLQSAISCYLDGGSGGTPDWLGCTFDKLATSFGGEATFGFIVGAALLFIMYRASGEMALPTVTLILLGGFAIPMMPPQYRTMALAITVVGFTAGLWTVMERYVLSGAAA